MQISTHTHPVDGAIELALNGRFDAHEAAIFRDAFHDALDGGSHQVRVNLAGVEFVDSTALAELVRGMKRCRELHGDLTLVSPSDPVRVILELTKLDAAFDIERVAG